MVSTSRTVNGRTDGAQSPRIDPCVRKLEELWEDGLPDNIDVLSKSLRLLVFYVRGHDGVPEKYQASVRAKIETLELLLEDMTLEDVILAVPAIKYARRQIKATVEYGTRFRTGISNAEAAKARRIGKRVQLNTPGPLDSVRALDDLTFERDGFCDGSLDDEKFE